MFSVNTVRIVVRVIANNKAFLENWPEVNISLFSLDTVVYIDFKHFFKNLIDHFEKANVSLVNSFESLDRVIANE